ncbi:predicted protein [Nematostella vectensis]|uniref:Uncharacterized protein n=1 Tax=Nematostella vectensis TaxID=45351 RepID=A7T034_NEMVE|nr:predicted protein [Nematostella vectensis]|eukprot:XP_001622784.1 predicted protein [Nematostella vectensis]
MQIPKSNIRKNKTVYSEKKVSEKQIIFVEECKNTTSIKFTPTIPVISVIRFEVYEPEIIKGKRRRTSVDKCLLNFEHKTTPDFLIIKGICDNIIQPSVELDYHFLPVSASANLGQGWDRYVIHPIKVRVLNTDTGTCSSTGDPHYRTFDNNTVFQDKGIWNGLREAN